MRRCTGADGDAAATSSGVETLTLGSSPGARLHPKIVQPPFSA